MCRPIGHETQTEQLTARETKDPIKVSSYYDYTSHADQEMWLLLKL
jgi:hypothetical protein